MAFLDNSGDIILDAVLTDAGRKRLAQGDGTFRVVKFALSDDEIDYGLFNRAHPSGSAYFDLEIMQTPVLEAFTNNTSSLKHKLISMSQTNLLYLPVLKLFSNATNKQALKSSTFSNGTFNSGFQVHETTEITGTGLYVLPADDTTRETLDEQECTHYLKSTTGIRTIQGIDSDDLSFRRAMASNMVETQYIIQCDYRMLRLTDSAMNMKAESYIDDDMIASYYLSRNIDDTMVKPILAQDRSIGGNGDRLAQEHRIIKGPAGTIVDFNFTSSEEIQTSFSLFDEFGGTQVSNNTGGAKNYKFIDTNIRVTGATTGSSIDIPIRILKYNPS